MHLHSLAFRNFRRLKDARIDFADDLTIFVGANNSGKTSATHAIDLFLSGARDKFTIHDFCADCWRAFEAKPAEGDDAPPFELPVISLDVWISVDADNLYRVVELLPRAAWEGSLVGLRIEFSAKDANQTFANFQAQAEEAAKFAKTKDKDGQDYRPWPRNMRDYLSRELRNEYGLRYFILDEAQLKPNAAEEAFATKEMIADTERSGHTVINSLIKVDFLSAQRHLSDGHPSRNPCQTTVTQAPSLKRPRMKCLRTTRTLKTAKRTLARAAKSLPSHGRNALPARPAR